jgi:hypothetical protein
VDLDAPALTRWSEDHWRVVVTVQLKRCFEGDLAYYAERLHEEAEGDDNGALLGASISHELRFFDRTGVMAASAIERAARGLLIDLASKGMPHP